MLAQRTVRTINTSSSAAKRAKLTKAVIGIILLAGLINGQLKAICYNIYAVYTPNAILFVNAIA